MQRPYISLTSDFGVQTQGVGLMEGVAHAIAPNAFVLHLMHGLPAFEVIAAARTLESVQYLPVGIHVCVCDPGVGSHRKAIVIQALRGDYLVGPDNGVLIPASRLLGGIVCVHEITSEQYMRQPVSPIFHGRDIFVPVAAHLAKGVPITEFGPLLDSASLSSAPYEEAHIAWPRVLASVIQINRFGSIHLNISHQSWDALGVKHGSRLRVTSHSFGTVVMPFMRIFSDVPKGQPLVLKDDYGRVEIAINLGSFIDKYRIAIGDEVSIDAG